MKILPARLAKLNKGNMVNRMYRKDVKAWQHGMYTMAGGNAAFAVNDIAIGEPFFAVLSGVLAALCIWVGKVLPTRCSSLTDEYKKIAERAKNIKQIRDNK